MSRGFGEVAAHLIHVNPERFTANDRIIRLNADGNTENSVFPSAFSIINFILN
jgi:hypothetical protein